MRQKPDGPPMLWAVVSVRALGSMLLTGVREMLQSWSRTSSAAAGSAIAGRSPGANWKLWRSSMTFATRR